MSVVDVSKISLNLHFRTNMHFLLNIFPAFGRNNSLVGGTVGENIIATTKIRNDYGAIQSFIFPILR